MESVANLIATGDRQRTPLEARPELTDSYARLILAIGFARLGAVARARELEDAAVATLAPFNDAVHDLLTRWLRFRIEEATCGRTCRSDAPAQFTTTLANLERARRISRRQSQYTVWRLLDQTRQLEPNARRETTSPLALWMGGVRELEPVGDDALLALAALPTELAFPDLAAATAEAARGTPVTAARGCYVAARDGFTELVVDRIPALTSCTDPELAVALRYAVRALVWCEMRVELEAMLAALPAVVERPRSLQRIIDATGAYLGKPGGDLVAAAHPDVARGVLPERLTDTRELAAAATYAGPEVGGEILRALATRFHDVTDSYGTNSHFCLSVLEFVESLALGHTELALAGTDSIGVRATGFIF